VGSSEAPYARVLPNCCLQVKKVSNLVDANPMEPMQQLRSAMSVMTWAPLVISGLVLLFIAP
jgi:hypothetical protein